MKTTPVSVLCRPLGCRTADHYEAVCHAGTNRSAGSVCMFLSLSPHRVLRCLVFSSFSIFIQFSQLCPPPTCNTDFSDWFLSTDLVEDALCFGHQVLSLVPASHPKKSQKTKDENKTKMKVYDFFKHKKTTTQQQQRVQKNI